jgi:hypothetical protein
MSITVVIDSAVGAVVALQVAGLVPFLDRGPRRYYRRVEDATRSAMSQTRTSCQLQPVRSEPLEIRMV